MQMNNLDSAIQNLYNLRYKKIFMVMSILVLCGIFIPEAYANLNTLGDKVNSRITDIINIVNKTAKVGVCLGFAYFVFTFLKGEPNYRYAGSLIVGGCLIILGSYVTSWMLA